MARFMAFSGNREQIEGLKNYIEGLYEKERTDGACGSRLAGGPMSLCARDGRYILSGEHSKGSVYDLVFRASMDHMAGALAGIVYAEGDGASILAYRLYPEAANGKAPEAYRAIDGFDANGAKEECPEEVKNAILGYIRDGILLSGN